MVFFLSIAYVPNETHDSLLFLLPNSLTPLSQPEFITSAINRPALGSFPPKEWNQWLQEGLLTVAPKGLDQLITTLCGSSANGEW